MEVASSPPHSKTLSDGALIACTALSSASSIVTPLPAALRLAKARLLRAWALPLLLRHMRIEGVLEMLGCALTEMRLVVVCEDLQLLSAAVLAIVLLLRPLVWAGPLIVTLPAKLYDFVEVRGGGGASRQHRAQVDIYDMRIFISYIYV
jgi:hypothetical protein